MQREKRVRMCPDRFTPTERNIRPTHYLLHFDDTASYNIVSSSSIYKVSGTTATVNLRGKKIMGTVVISGNLCSTFRASFSIHSLLGTLQMCEDEQRKCTRASQEDLADDVGKSSLILLIKPLKGSFTFQMRKTDLLKSAIWVHLVNRVFN